MARKKKNEVQIFRNPKDIDKDIIAFSRDFNQQLLNAVGLKKWTGFQANLFMYLLGEIDWRDKVNKNVIEIDNLKFMEAIGWDMSNSKRRIKELLEKELYEMIENSTVKLYNPYDEEFIIEHLILSAKGNNYITEIELNPDLMPHFEQLYTLATDNKIPFVQYLKPDLLSLKTSHANRLFWEFKYHSHNGGSINIHKLTTKQLKELLGLDESSYVIKSTNKFDRSNFEKRVLIPSLEAIDKSEMISIIKDDDGNYFTKEKAGPRVRFYVFKYVVLSNEQIAENRKKRLEEQNAINK